MTWALPARVRSSGAPWRRVPPRPGPNLPGRANSARIHAARQPGGRRFRPVSGRGTVGSSRPARRARFSGRPDRLTSAAERAVAGFSKALAIELEQLDVTVNVAGPGSIATPRRNVLAENVGPEAEWVADLPALLGKKNLLRPGSSWTRPTSRLRCPAASVPVPVSLPSSWSTPGFRQ